MLTLRHAQASDAAAMRALQQRAFAEEARRCGTLVGCVRGLVDDRICTVRGLVVAPLHHGGGIGSRLLKALEAELRGVEHTRPVPGIVLAQMSKPFVSAGQRPMRGRGWRSAASSRR